MGEVEEMGWPLKHLPARALLHPGYLQDPTTTKTDVQGTVFSGTLTNNTLDFAKIEITTRKYFPLLVEKKIATRTIHACNVLVFYALCNCELILRGT